MTLDLQPVSQMVLPLEKTDELQYMAELRQELLTRFHESSFYLDTKERCSEFRRYTDRYSEIEKEELQPGYITSHISFIFSSCSQNLTLMLAIFKCFFLRGVSKFRIGLFFFALSFNIIRFLRCSLNFVFILILF